MDHSRTRRGSDIPGELTGYWGGTFTQTSYHHQIKEDRTMRTSSLTPRRRTRMIGSIMILGVALFAFGLAGCQSGDTSTQGSNLTASTDDGTFIEPITLSAVQAKMALNSDQESQMQSALDRYNRAVESRRAQRQQAREDGERGFRGRPAGERPLHTLLKESADILDADQMVALLEVIGEQIQTRREQAREQRANRADGRRGGRGFRGHQGPGQEMFADLDLTEDQRTQLAELRDEHREAMQTLREQHGGERGFGRSDEAVALREQMHDDVEAILTPEQLEQLDANRIERREDRRERRQEGMIERQEARVELLTAVLDLSEAQASQLETILATTHDRMQELHESIGDDRPDRDVMREQIEQIREETHDAIVALLNDEQKAVFEAMTDLLPSGPHGRRGPH
ncbi:MAG: hypothetical protein GF341_08720 [candidate division Zixibacteria bacterium]|nr:hypothetical protein [candidate division Zixibacteria bacterium]